MPRNFFIRVLNKLTGKQSLPPGIRVGAGVHIGDATRLDWSHGRHITLCDHVTLAPGVRILCHDSSSFRRHGITWVAPVHIGERVFIGAEAVVMPGVSIGADAIVAAGAVVTRDVAEGCIVAGVPAVPIGRTVDLDKRRLQQFETLPVFSSAEYAKENLDPAKDAELQNASRVHGGYFLK